MNQYPYTYELTEIYSKKVDIIGTNANKSEFGTILDELRTIEDYTFDDIEFLLIDKGFTYRHYNANVTEEFDW